MFWVACLHYTAVYAQSEKGGEARGGSVNAQGEKSGGGQGRPANAQNRYTISGTVRDRSSGEVLIGATISLQEMPRSGILSNAYGFYSITAPAGKYTLLISFSGYQQEPASARRSYP